MVNLLNCEQCHIFSKKYVLYLKYDQETEKINMTIKITQRGGNKSYLPFIQHAVNFFANELMTKRMLNNTNITVAMRTSGRGSNTEGHVFVECAGSKKQHNYYINCCRKSSLFNKMLILAHETVHVQQIRTNRYQLRTWKSDGQLHARWEGKELGPVDYIPYDKHPWEIEAYATQTNLVKSLISNKETTQLFNNEIKTLKKQLLNM